MTATTTRSPEVTAALVAHALMALGTHMAEHNLPCYSDLRTPHPRTGIDHVELHITPDVMSTWAASIALDRVEILPRESAMFPFERRYLGRLPGTGVRVVLVELLEDMPTGVRGLLEVVSS